MRQQRSFLSSLTFILWLIILVSCTAPAVGPTLAPTQPSAATVEPTAIPVTVITPIPLPTLVPNQAELINKATTNHPVDFVIDTQQLKRGLVPPRFMTLDTWYKYTSPDGAFSVLMHGGVAPKETILDDQQGTLPLGTKVVRADYLMWDPQAVTYFEAPDLVTGALTPKQFLDSIDPAQVAQVMSRFAEVEIISDQQIQLSGFPGRNIALQATPKDMQDMKMKVHLRFYIVGNTVYQLTYLDTGIGPRETEARFLDSFTLHAAAE